MLELYLNFLFPFYGYCIINIKYQHSALGSGFLNSLPFACGDYTSYIDSPEFTPFGIIDSPEFTPLGLQIEITVTH